MRQNIGCKSGRRRFRSGCRKESLPCYLYVCPWLASLGRSSWSIAIHMTAIVCLPRGSFLMVIDTVDRTWPTAHTCADYTVILISTLLKTSIVHYHMTWACKWAARISANTERPPLWPLGHRSLANFGPLLTFLAIQQVVQFEFTFMTGTSCTSVI